jgi:anthranilate synthase component 1
MLKAELNGTLTVHPIAGTRRRGATVEEDDTLAADLLSDAKERAEHLMLVDLGRNDVGRVSAPGTVRVPSLMHIERYSHVMHIVSNVQGALAARCTSFDAFRSVFPAGTVSGAPKLRAIELVATLEPSRRGLYAGCVGCFGYDGAIDTAIAIRTLVVLDGVVHLQAGAGIVFDSVPASEYDETVAKLRATMRCVDAALETRARAKEAADA